MELKIKHKLEERLHKRNNIITILLVISSGVVSLMYNLHNIVNIILLFIGILGIIIFIQGLVSIEEQIRRLINDL